MVCIPTSTYIRTYVGERKEKQSRDHVTLAYHIRAAVSTWYGAVGCDVMRGGCDARRV